jgi:tRNA-dihydrouridine synthase B
MAGVTDYPFRAIVRKFGAGLVVSEMIASRAVLEALKHENVRKRLHFYDSQKEKGAIALQIVGYDPDIMAEAAKFNEQLGASLIDINMGCPVRKVVHTEAGAALMKDEVLASRVIRAVVQAVRVPVTVKMRLGWDSQSLNAPRIARIAEQEGASAVTIHGRTRSQFYEGKADWAAIRKVKETVRIPVIGNGDVLSVENAQSLLSLSGADAVMVGRGACGRPWLLHEIEQNLNEKNVVGRPELPSLKLIVQEHVALMLEHYGVSRGLCMSRKHLSGYSRGLKDSADFRAKINACNSEKTLKDLIHSFFS